MRAVALRLGALQNQSELARDIKLPQPTIHRYLNLLETSYQLVRLLPYAKNRTLRLIKAPKLYWSDTGMALYLSGETTLRGEHLENLILGDLLAWRDTCLPKPDIYYWRTAARHEVDFVIETPTGQLLPIEVKATAHPRTRDLASLQTFKDEYDELVLGGLVLHGGTDTYWIADGILATPWWKVV
jgi:predicted AAA+ superfamily ATPase